MTKQKSPADLARTVRREAYTYLGNLPHKLTDVPPGAERAVAEFAIAVGKYLKWIAGTIDQHAGPDSAKLATLADSILAVGVVLYDGKPCVTHRQRTMQLALDSLTAQIHHLRNEFDYEQAQ